MASFEEIHWDTAALDELLKGTHGIIAVWLGRVGLRVESQAKLNASGRPGPNVQTGRLRSSITWQLGKDEIGLYVDVGSGVYYAGYVELGTSRAPAYPYLRPALPAANIF